MKQRKERKNYDKALDTGIDTESRLRLIVNRTPDDIEGVSAMWREAVATGEPLLAESRVRRADGKYCWMLHRYVPLVDDQGNIVRWLG